MKITYIANLRLPSERAHSIQIMKMCEAFSRQGAEVELVVPDKRNNLGEEKIFDYYGIRNQFRITKISSMDLLGKTKSFGKLFYLLDLFSFVLSLILQGKIAKESIVYTRDPVLTLPFMGSHQLWVEIHDIPRRPSFFNILLKKANGIVVITHHLKKLLEESVSRNTKIIVAPDAVSLEDFEDPISQDEARRELGLPLDRKIVMYIGLLDEWKGYHTLLEASQGLPTGVQIVLIGGSAAQVIELQKQYPKVLFLGFRPYKSLPRHQRAADALVIPNSGRDLISKYFTSPLKLFSHMASGVPMIVSDLPSLREVVDESTAFLFTPDDPVSLSTVIKQALSNHEDAKLRSAKALNLSKGYSWDNRAKEVMKNI